MIEHLETVHEEENKGWNHKRNLAPTNSSDGKISSRFQVVAKPKSLFGKVNFR